MREESPFGLWQGIYKIIVGDLSAAEVSIWRK